MVACMDTPGIGDNPELPPKPRRNSGEDSGIHPMRRPASVPHHVVVTNSSPSQQLIQLWRTRPHRTPERGPIAGVAAAFGYRYAIDPTLVRIAFVVTTIFGGTGIFLYLLAWLTLPRAGTGKSMADMLMGRGNSGDSHTAAVLVAVATLVSLLTSAPVGVGLGASGPLSLIAMAAGWWLLFKRTPTPPFTYPVTGATGGPTIAGSTGGFGTAGEFGTAGAYGSAASLWESGVTRQPGSGHPTNPSPTDTPTAGGGSSWNAYSVLPERYEPSPKPTVDAAPTTTDGATGASAASVTSGTSGPVSFTKPAAQPGPPAWDPLGVAPFAWDLPDPTGADVPEQVKSSRSHYTSKVIGAAIVVTAITAGVGLVTGADWVTVARLSAVALLVIGLGLFFGGMRGRGRGRGLLFAAVPLAAVVVAASVTPPDLFELSGDTVVSGETTQLRPQSDADLSDSYAVGFGELDLDLSDLTLTEDRTVDISSRFAETTITVPEDMRVQTTCDAKMAEALCDIPAGTANADSPLLTLDINARFSDVEVVRHG